MTNLKHTQNNETKQPFQLKIKYIKVLYLLTQKQLLSYFVVPVVLWLVDIITKALHWLTYGTELALKPRIWPTQTTASPPPPT